MRRAHRSRLRPSPPTIGVTLDTLREKPLRRFDVRPQILAEDLYLVLGRDAFLLGDVEATIWGLCDGEHSIIAIADQIVAEYDVEVDVAVEDVSEFIASLRSNKLLDS